MRQVAAIVLCFMSLSVFGHGGEDHGAPPPVSPATPANLAPRTAVATEQFEVVMALEGKHLLLYVDDFASNAPVANAVVEVEGAGMKGVAYEGEPGTYVLDLAATLPAARHPLTISIEVGESTELLAATLDASPPTPTGAPVDGESGWAGGVVWIMGTLLTLLLLAVGAALATRRYRKVRGV